LAERTAVGGRRGPGLRVRLTLLATALTAGVSGVLLWLGWLLVGNVVGTTPDLPFGSTIVVDGVQVTAAQWANLLRDHARERVLQAGSVAFRIRLLFPGKTIGHKCKLAGLGQITNIGKPHQGILHVGRNNI